MSKRLKFEVELGVSDSVDPKRAAELLEVMLTDLEQDENYHNVFILHGVRQYDEDLYKLFDMIDMVDERKIDAAISAVNELEEGNE